MWQLKKFNQLELEDLYQILKNRVDIFVVEQKCAYPEIDGIDPDCYHLFKKDGNEIVAYARLVPNGVLYNYPAIGRIIVNQNYRKSGYGRELIKQAIKIITEDWQEPEIKLHGQTYLREFYQSFGFKEISEPYLEDGIPHVDMLYKK
ncbi:GNAT family N-acetyltransferase [Amphibacillus xylanus]|uniref:Putative acetyltransferase n=1 Tax=Amphibacillus xylanus (strain ATCC 51415 / DSM 6626 / JCM 7361 / LMG 17667 / NBRC 15112 / Ep01) TaxID=698758 RepID=K0IVK6_AMPXN|nr:GNAT family N-acetyltransferase [Amphibacillus xylanus]BAM46450.1 putative acetyltransferase [Amphibacillus xylanus NBRC 15112]